MLRGRIRFFPAQARMSYRIGIDTIHLRPTPRLAHTEYCTSDPLKRHFRRVFGDVRFEDAFEMDFIWHTDDGPVPWSQRGRTTDMGHAAFLEAGTDMRPPKPCPFADIDEVLAFDAVAEYGLPDFDDLVAWYENLYRTRQAQFPEQVLTGGYYKTIVSGAIEAFGWDMLLQAAGYRQEFERVLDSFFRLSMHHFRAWAKTSAPVFICHDDFVWTSGPFMAPDFYRSAIFPRYAELFAVIRKAGKKLLFCSDGCFTAFIDDVAAAGADGFIFEPLTSFDYIVRRYGQTHVIVSSLVDCRTLTFGTPADIRREIDATIERAFQCPGFIFAVGNHIPSNVPVENVMFYFDYLRKHWTRP